MRSITVIVLHACLALAVAKEQTLTDRAKTTSNANLDLATLAKPHAGTNLRPLGTMNRLALPSPALAGALATNHKLAAKMPTLRTLPDLIKVKAGGIAGEVIGERYARVLFELAEDGKELEAVKGEAELFQLTLSQVPELADAFEDPTKTLEMKKALLDKILEEGGTLHKMCNYLADQQRIELIPQILGSFEKQYNDATSTEMCKVTSACKMTEEQIFQIAQQVQKLTGAKSVKVQETIDESLIGGFKIQYGVGYEVDYTIRAKINGYKKLMEEMSQVK